MSGAGNAIPANSKTCLLAKKVNSFFMAVANRAYMLPYWRVVKKIVCPFSREMFFVHSSCSVELICDGHLLTIMILARCFS